MDQANRLLAYCIRQFIYKIKFTSVYTYKYDSNKHLTKILILYNNMYINATNYLILLIPIDFSYYPFTYTKIYFRNTYDCELRN